MPRRLAVLLAFDMVGFSRLVERDEAGTLERQKRHRRDIVDPAIADRGGDIVKTTGDGMLVAFDTVQGAAEAALHIQSAMDEREAGQGEDARIRYRIGLHLGDIVFEDGDVFGGTVNLAARLEALAAPGGVCLSDPVFQLLDRAQQDRFDDLGLQRVKNIQRPVRVWQWSPEMPERTAAPVEDGLNQKIGFCIADDGVQLAYASLGAGPTVFKAPNWMNHLDYEWQNPLTAATLLAVGRHHRLVRFDQRGNGLSDWDVDTISEDVMISDMVTVADAAGLDRFALWGQSQGCAFSVRFAVENPDRVSCLVLLSGYARGALKRGTKEQAGLHAAMQSLILEGWGSPNPAYRHVFTETMVPDASPALKTQMDERQRMATSPENAARINEMNAGVDVSTLARAVRVPTLVLHCQGDRRVPLEEGRRLAALIPGAEFVTLPGANHVPVEGSEAFDLFQSRFRDFVADHAQ